MTITYYDKFTILPKRCGNCNRVFIFEGYNWYYKDIPPYCSSLKMNICKKCIEAKK